MICTASSAVKVVRDLLARDQEVAALATFSRGTLRLLYVAAALNTVGHRGCPLFLANLLHAAFKAVQAEERVMSALCKAALLGSFRPWSAILGAP